MNQSIFEKNIGDLIRLENGQLAELVAALPEAYGYLLVKLVCFCSDDRCRGYSYTATHFDLPQYSF